MVCSRINTLSLLKKEETNKIKLSTGQGVLIHISSKSCPAHVWSLPSEKVLGCKFPLAIYFTRGNVYVSMLLSPFVPPSPLLSTVVRRPWWRAWAFLGSHCLGVLTSLCGQGVWLELQQQQQAHCRSVPVSPSWAFLCWNCLIQEPESAEQRWGVGFYAHAQKIASEWVIVAQLLPTLCDPMDHGPSGSFVHGILQARILDWVAISFSRPRRECLKKLAGLGAAQLTRDSCLLDRKYCSGQRQGLKALRTSGSSMPGGSFCVPTPCNHKSSSLLLAIVQTFHACLLHGAFSDCWPVRQPLTPGPVIQLLNTLYPLPLLLCLISVNTLFTPECTHPSSKVCLVPSFRSGTKSHLFKEACPHFPRQRWQEFCISPHSPLLWGSACNHPPHWWQVLSPVSPVVWPCTHDNLAVLQFPKWGL